MTLRKKAAYSYAIAFVVLWGICSTFIFIRFRSEMLKGFDDQMRVKALIVAERTSINPRVVPLPQGEEMFLIIHETEMQRDLLFSPPAPDDRNIWLQRYVEIEQEDEDGTIRIVYSLPTTEVDRSIRTLFLIIMIVFIGGLTFSWMLGYWLSGKILKPVRQVIKRANETDILHTTELLEEPHQENELKELIVSFNRMLLRIRTQADQQNAFFASASHELRTPLSVMQTHLQVMLHDSTLTQETKQVYLDQLREVQRMIKMVNDFLLMSELKNGTVKVWRTECDLVTIVMDAFSCRKEKMKERGLQFRISLLPEEALFKVQADGDKLRIILENLIDNAIKYALERSLIQVDLTGENGIRVMIRNAVRPDIHPDIHAIANHFYHSKPLQGEGSGLGLWISGQLASLQGFSLSLSMPEKDVFCAELLID